MSVKQTKVEFTIKGWLYDHVTLKWKDGQLMSDQTEVLQVIKKRIQELEESKAFIQCPETGLFYTDNYLKEPFCAYLVLKHILDVIYEEPDKKELLPVSLSGADPRLLVKETAG
ncbi:hypothetical protein ACFO25_05160 [Paenactinomyces guangxiensis]|uniref:Uncharacterized protein n=1 Tax=Paenactinomyces guangxiensis TaxID=1490290 RepID=A0A7W1WQ08_9BACL|nr:hypothetical protein [Paenactinomyces guangxiensis]MBA4493766.1 hypothetical protein [Paenactinomyces guangxiensis]MBH8591055.1 hypothetical protein [Paenactinomyces guangxiensis]